jgi:multidrug efflux pump subunit AcrB
VKDAIAWAAKTPVFANLLMIFLIVAGGFATFSMTREMFPEFSFDKVMITVPYPGATPDELEDSVAVKIEEAIRGVEGVRLIETTVSEGSALVMAEIDSQQRDPRDALVDIRNEISRISTFPEDVKEPVVSLQINRREVSTLALWGDLEERSLATLAREIEQELLTFPEVSEVSTEGIRDFQINVLVREGDLQRYGMTIERVSAAIRGASLDLPLGRLRSDSEEQILRVEAEQRVGRELAELVIMSRADGTQIRLRDVADIDDGFAEQPLGLRVDGTPAVTFKVQRTSDQDVVAAAERVKAYLAARRESLPPGVKFELWKDHSVAVTDRLGLLTKNGSQGLLLVFVALLIFLGVRLSFWVAAGLPVAFMAAMILLLGFGGSLNMISSFALIMILGILVDDSIVVAENIARHMREGGYTLESALAGLEEVTMPVIASVTTTAIAFMPLFYLSGIMGKFIRIMPVAVVACLIASLIECLLILPAHLAHAKPPSRDGTLLQRLRRKFDEWSDGFIENRYGPTVDFALRWRYPVAVASLGFLIVVAGLVASGRPRFVFFPSLDADTVQATLTMPQGTSYERTAEIVARVEKAAREVGEGLPPAADGKPITRRIKAKVGNGGSNQGHVELELCKSEDRAVTSSALVGRWRKALGAVPEATSINFAGSRHRPGGKPIELRILPRDPAHAEPMIRELRQALARFPGVYNVDDNLEPGKRELRLGLKAPARNLGLNERELAVQVQYGFTGREVQKLQRGREEVEVRVRYARQLRRDQTDLDHLRLRSESGALVPLGWAAFAERDRGLSKIERRDGRRVVTISAEVDDAVTNANEVVSALKAETLGDLLARYPADANFGGAQEEQKATLTSLLVGFLLAMFGIYAILALLFNSYLQPAVVMAAVPIGFGGAIVGHIVFGLPLTIFSIFGMVGLTGIVVNDSLVLIDAINRRRRSGSSAWEAASSAGRIRFRAVFLTTLTTVAGLLPLLLETSLTAQFVIPMAVSIASGVAAATLLTLYVVPCVYLIIEDLRLRLVREVPVEAPAPKRELVSAG